MPWKTAELLPEPAKAMLRTYAYRELEHHSWVLCGDNARHMNHSFDSNVKSSGLWSEDRAVRDIRAGEEMTIDYRDFDPDFEKEAAEYS